MSEGPCLKCHEESIKYFSFGDIPSFVHCHHEPELIFTNHTDLGQVGAFRHFHLEGPGYLDISIYLSRFNLSDGRTISSYFALEPSMTNPSWVRQKLDRAMLLDAGMSEEAVKKSILNQMEKEINKEKSKCWCETWRFPEVINLTDSANRKFKPNFCPECGKKL